MPPTTTPLTPQLIAHRGYARHYPENTLIAFSAALAAGANFLETDVQLSADGVPVLFHDRTLARVCAQPGAVHQHTAAQLQGFAAAETDRFGYRFVQNRIATLAQFVELVARAPGVRAFVEIKRVALEQFGNARVLAAIAPILAPIAERVILISFDRGVLADARAYPQPAWHAIGGVVDFWRERRAFRALAPEYLFCDVDGLPRFGRLRFGTARLAIYEVDDARSAMRLHRRGVELVETFAFAELRAALALLPL